MADFDPSPDPRCATDNVYWLIFVAEKKFGWNRFSIVAAAIAGIPRRRQRHRHGHPREDVGGDVGVGVRFGVGAVECELIYALAIDEYTRRIIGPTA